MGYEHQTHLQLESILLLGGTQVYPLALWAYWNMVQTNAQKLSYCRSRQPIARNDNNNSLSERTRKKYT